MVALANSYDRMEPIKQSSYTTHFTRPAPLRKKEGKTIFQEEDAVCSFAEISHNNVPRKETHDKYSTNKFTTKSFFLPEKKFFHESGEHA